MGVAKDNLCPHVNQAVNEEQSALKHLLMEEHGAACLGTGNDTADSQLF